MKIEVTSPMKLAAEEGMNGYLPTFRGEELAVEMSDPAASLKNLRKLLKAGLKVLSVTMFEGENVLVVFTTGETYLATGFTVGEVDDVSFFAQFLSEAGLGKTSEWLHTLRCYSPEDMAYPFEMKLERGFSLQAFDPDSED